MGKLAELFHSAKTPADYARAYCDRLTSLLDGLNTETVAQVIQAFEGVAEQDATLFLIANGGSAAAATHCVNDLGPNTFVEGAKPFHVMCLTDNIASITSIANDSSFDDIFEHQLRVYLRPGDVVLAMSASGNSENVVRGVQFANAHGAKTIGFIGFAGGRLAEEAQIVLHIPTTPDEYGPVEDFFSILCHVIVGYISMNRGRFLGHDGPC